MSVIVLLAIWGSYLKIEFTKTKKISKRIKARVIQNVYEHRNSKYPINDYYVRLYYPYVKIDLNEPEGPIVVRVEYGRPYRTFKVVECIDVFWYGGKLFYWNTYGKGLFKLLPEKTILQSKKSK